MTTAGIMEIRGLGGRRFIYGTHDSYPDGWPVLVVKFLMGNKLENIEEAVKKALRVLWEWDYDVHKQTADWNYFRDWKEREAYLRRTVRNDFRQIRDSDIPNNLEKGWEYWYIVDLEKGIIIIKHITSKMCVEYDHGTNTGKWYICGEEERVIFKGSLNDFLSKYFLTQIS